METNELHKDYNPYYQVCSGCGEDDCCSAINCQQSKDGKYCETYLNDLKFGYLMFKDLYELVDEKTAEEIYDKNYEIIYEK